MMTPEQEFFLREHWESLDTDMLSDLSEGPIRLTLVDEDDLIRLAYLVHLNLARTLVDMESGFLSWEITDAGKRALKRKQGTCL